MGNRDRAVDPTDKPILTVCGGPNDGMTIPIVRPVFTMGRHPDNDVIVSQGGISPTHAEIFRAYLGYYVRDLGSKGGTFVNLHNIGDAAHLLREGDRIGLANSGVSLVFRSVDGPTHIITMTEAAPGREVAETPSIADQLEVAGPSQPGDESAYRPGEIAGMPEEPSQSSGRDLYEGNVKLTVGAEDDILQLVYFVSTLHQMPQVRLLRLECNAQNVEIYLSLREPIHLREILSQVQGVTEVSAPQEHEDSPPDHERMLDVQMERPSSGS